MSEEIESASGPRQLRGSQAYSRGHLLEKSSGDLYRLLGYSVEVRRGFSGREVDLLLHKRDGDIEIIRAVECKSTSVTVDHFDAFVAKLALVRKEFPAATGTILSDVGFATAVSSHAAAAGITLTLFSDLQAALMDSQSYCRLLLNELASNETYRFERFVEPQIIDPQGRVRPALSVFDDWLADPEWNQLTLLGDVGTGKSFLTRKLAYRLAVAHLENPSRASFPLRIDLRETDRLVSLEGVVLTHFASHGLRSASFDTFLHASSSGRLVLILDGFDEMAARINPAAVKRNFHQFARAVGEHSKMLLTCRTHYFRSRGHAEDVVLGKRGELDSAEINELYWELISRRGYRIAYVQPFSPNEIEQFVIKVAGDESPRMLARIAATYNLPELARCPMLLGMIVQSIRSLREHKVDAATLYGVYTNAWIHREIWRDGMSSEERLEFVLDLASSLWNLDTTQIHYMQLASYVESRAARTLRAVDALNAEALDAEVRTAAFLTRDDAGNYGFAHKSYLEYFLARAVAGQIGTGQIETALTVRRFSPEVLQFLVDLLGGREVEEALEQILLAPYVLQRSENALLVLHALRRDQLPVGVTVSLPDGLQLQGARLDQATLPGASMKGADLRNAQLKEAALFDGDLSGAYLDGATLQNANLVRTNLSKATFVNTILDGANCDDASFDEATFQGTSLRAASFVGARMHGISLEGCTVADAVFDDAIGLDAAPQAAEQEAEPPASETLEALIRRLGIFYGALYAVDADELIAESFAEIRLPDDAPPDDLDDEVRLRIERIARAMRDRTRRRRRQRGREIDADYVTLADREPSAEDRLRQREMAVLLGDALMHLSPKARTIVQLRFVNGSTMREIATMLSMPQASVARMLSTALRTLRQYLEEATSSRIVPRQ